MKKTNSIWADLQGVAFDQGYVDVDGIRTRYLHAGQKGSPALVFLHGTGGHAEAYVRNLDAHAKHFDVYAVDMLGHGYTDKPDYDYEVPLYVKHVAGFSTRSASIVSCYRASRSAAGSHRTLPSRTQSVPQSWFLTQLAAIRLITRRSHASASYPWRLSKTHRLNA